MNKFFAKLTSKAAEMYVTKIVWVLAVIIVGMLLMWGLHSIYAETVLPGLDDQINDLFVNGNNAIDDANASDFTSGGYVG